MLNSPSLEVAIGLVFCFASIALIASATTEALASLFGFRSKTLLTGVKTLLNDPGLQGLALAVYNHALVHPRGDGNIPSGAKNSAVKNAPSYIDPKAFATALIDHLQQTPGNLVKLKSSIDSIPDLQIRKLLQGMWVRANGDISVFKKQIADWFDNGMDRVSGLYKRNAQAVTFVLALTAAVCMNVDSIFLAQQLWKQPSLTSQITVTPSLHPKEPTDKDKEPKTETIESVVSSMERLPIGRSYSGEPGSIIWDLVGVLLTASAAMFGAPFWFDILQSLVQLRSSGPKPSPQAKDKAAT